MKNYLLTKMSFNVARIIRRDGMVMKLPDRHVGYPLLADVSRSDQGNSGGSRATLVKMERSDILANVADDPT